ncbi:hypothetical protein [Prosthecochloris sp. ZM]|uniref:hypothetical protein n=1 Tax=Prosthecochloris sp. ZM TaxID=2283143 RepID=UPI0002F23A54|nr:hypothetical protein [Prosthecochloris sp. ZM]
MGRIRVKGLVAGAALRDRVDVVQATTIATRISIFRQAIAKGERHESYNTT